MLIPSYIKRLNHLRTSLSFTLKNPPNFLHEIIINWQDSKDEIEKLIKDLNNQTLTSNISIRYFIYNDTTVNRRFLYPPDIKTKVILSLDDDILMKPNDIDYGYQVWKNHTNQIVGYTPKGITIIGNSLKYFHKIPRMILTGIAFLNTKLIDLYYNNKNIENVEFVKKLNNCEDILMNYVATKEYNVSAVYVVRAYNQFSEEGLASAKGNFEKRSICLNKFYKFFGVYPQPIKDIYR